MKKIIFGIILTIAAGWVINLFMVGDSGKNDNSAQAAVSGKAGEVPKGVIIQEPISVKATTTENVKPAPNKTAETITKLVAKTTAKKPAPVATKKPAVTKVTIAASKTVSGMTWDASALKMISSMVQFDYSNVIRQAYINKVNAYAKRNGIKTVTASVINNMRE
jgi:hypothetical protein